MIITIVRILILWIFLFSISQSKADVVINEIMPAPLDGEPEWIELYNNSTIPANLIATTISDLASSKKLPDIILQPAQYAIITKDTNFLKEYYDIDENVVMIQVTIPALNNTFDAVVLKDSDGSIIDSVYYDMKWGEKGISLERKDYNEKAINQENWEKSIEPQGGTPGYLNSTAIINYDITCRNIEVNQNFDGITIAISDEGKSKTEYFDFVLLADVEMSGIRDNFVVIHSENQIKFDERDLQIKVEMNTLKSKLTKSGTINLVAIINSELDQRRLNDTAQSSIFIKKGEPVIRINEIMYDVSKENAEYVELWNGGTDTLLLDNFVIWDAAGSLTKGNIKIISDDFKIAPDEYGVVVWDSSFFAQYPELIDKEYVYYYKSSFNLNLASDLIVIADASGKIYDSLTYFNSWHNKAVKETKNRSLEKVSPSLDSHYPENWSSCAETSGGTPGRKNSLAGEHAREGTLDISPNPFAPSLGGADANTIISYQLPYLHAYISASVYDINGFKISELTNNRYTGANGAFVWDGKNAEGYIVQVGQYILLIEATDADSGSVNQQKALIVVGK